MSEETLRVTLVFQLLPLAAVILYLFIWSCIAFADEMIGWRIFGFWHSLKEALSEFWYIFKDIPLLIVLFPLAYFGIMFAFVLFIGGLGIVAAFLALAVPVFGLPIVVCCFWGE